MFPVYAKGMDFHPTPEQEALIREAIAAGRITQPEDAITQALALWAERERGRAEFLGSLDRAEASIARGEGIAITQDSMRQLADDIGRRGRNCVAAEQPHL